MAESGPDLESKDKSLHYTYADYRDWEKPDQYQLFFGKAAPVSPLLPSHQALLRELLAQLGDYIEDRMVLPGSSSVRLFPNGIDTDDTIVKPDFFVPPTDGINDADKGLYTGVPEMVVEVVSPPKRYWEMFCKLLAYRKAGVREYWVINTDEKKVRTTIFGDGGTSVEYKNDALVPLSILPGVEIALEYLWTALDD